MITLPEKLYTYNTYDPNYRFGYLDGEGEVYDRETYFFTLEDCMKAAEYECRQYEESAKKNYYVIEVEPHITEGINIHAIAYDESYPAKLFSANVISGLSEHDIVIGPYIPEPLKPKLQDIRNAYSIYASGTDNDIWEDLYREFLRKEMPDNPAMTATVITAKGFDAMKAQRTLVCSLADDGSYIIGNEMEIFT